MVSDLKRVIDQVSREKGLDREVLIKTLEEAVKAAARKKLGPTYDLEVNFNDEIGEIEVFEFKEVVEKVENEHLQVSLEEAKQIFNRIESKAGDRISRTIQEIMGQQQPPPPPEAAKKQRFGKRKSVPPAPPKKK